MRPSGTRATGDVASVRTMNQDRSVSVSTAEASAGSKNDGQPVPDSNLVSLRKSSAPQPAHRYTPEPCSSQYLPVNARSVPFSRRTWYSSGVSSARHSASVLSSAARAGCDADKAALIEDGMA